MHLHTIMYNIHHVAHLPHGPLYSAWSLSLFGGLGIWWGADRTQIRRRADRLAYTQAKPPNKSIISCYPIYPILWLTTITANPRQSNRTVTTRILYASGSTGPVSKAIMSLPCAPKVVSH